MGQSTCLTVGGGGSWNLEPEGYVGSYQYCNPRCVLVDGQYGPIPSATFLAAVTTTHNGYYWQDLMEKACQDAATQD